MYGNRKIHGATLYLLNIQSVCFRLHLIRIYSIYVPALTQPTLSNLSAIKQIVPILVQCNTRTLPLHTCWQLTRPAPIGLTGSCSASFNLVESVLLSWLLFYC